MRLVATEGRASYDRYRASRVAKGADVSDLESQLRDAREKHAHCVRLLEAYDLVLEDLSDWSESDWLYVRQRVDFMRADIADARDEEAATIASIQSRCSHAHEKIGEARPPFWRCITCGHTQETQPRTGQP